MGEESVDEDRLPQSDEATQDPPSPGEEGTDLEKEIVENLTQLEKEEKERFDPGWLSRCLPPPLWVLAWYLVPLLINAGSYAADIVSDVAVSVSLYRDGHAWWASVTLLCVLAPAAMFLAFALAELLAERKHICWGVVYTVFSVFLLVLPFFYYLKQAWLCIKALRFPERRRRYLRKADQIAASQLMTVQLPLKSFLESAPQTWLQLHLLLRQPQLDQSPTTVALQVFSIVSSLHDLTLTVTSIQRRNAEGEPVFCACVEYLWWLCSSGSRLVALALFSVHYPYWAFGVCALHTLVVALLLRRAQKTPWRRFLPLLFLGFISVFCFVEYRVRFERLGRTITLYLLYYGFLLLQHVPMVVTAYVLADERLPFHVPMLAAHFTGFFLAILFMFTYLALLRPVMLRRPPDPKPEEMNGRTAEA